MRNWVFICKCSLIFLLLISMDFHCFYVLNMFRMSLYIVTCLTFIKCIIPFHFWALKPHFSKAVLYSGRPCRTATRSDRPVSRLVLPSGRWTSTAIPSGRPPRRDYIYFSSHFGRPRPLLT